MQTPDTTAAIKAIMPRAEWISVKDRLPRDGQFVLAATNHCIFFCYYRKDINTFVDRTDCLDIRVPYWMPLPTPPEGDK